MTEEPFYSGTAGRPRNQPLSVVPGGQETPIPPPPATLGEVGQEAWNRLEPDHRVDVSNGRADLILDA